MLYLLRHFYYCACRIECFYLIFCLLCWPKNCFRILITQRSGSIEHSWAIECEEIVCSLFTCKIRALVTCGIWNFLSTRNDSFVFAV